MNIIQKIHSIEKKKTVFKRESKFSFYHNIFITQKDCTQHLSNYLKQLPLFFSGQMMLGTFEIIGIVVAAAIFVVISFIFIKIWAQGGQFQKDAIRIDGKIVIITGGNGGIGRETALDLAKRGGTIYIACRDIAKAENAKQDIIKQSGNNNVFTMKLDLASFKSIREFVEE